MNKDDITKETIDLIVKKQRDFFKTGITLDIKFRKHMLNKLSESIDRLEEDLYQALSDDLHKLYEESFLTEISILKGEIHNHLKHINKWSKRQKIGTPLTLFPSKSYITKEPLGNTLIIAPWNYPVQLLLNPLIGAISSGCTAILKPSPYTPTVSRVLKRLISSTFEQDYIALIEGDRNVNQELLSHRFDLIFFTGSPELGKIVMTAAAKNLTPVVLELGGKSPCVVDKDADLAVAAKRIAWGKSINSGQTCIAPDYLLLHESIADKFIENFASAVKNLYPEGVQQSLNYARMVNEKAFRRVTGYIDNGKIAFGGNHDLNELFIEQTLLTNVDINSDVMKEEIFGPVFPIITFNDFQFIVDFINDREKPLALYYFGNEEKGWELIRRTSSGGACINDTIMHIANEKLPFGGVGNSGMGRYHGKESFDIFSHTRSVLATSTKIDMPFRYMPYKNFKLVEKLLKR